MAYGNQMISMINTKEKFTVINEFRTHENGDLKEVVQKIKQNGIV